MYLAPFTSVMFQHDLTPRFVSIRPSTLYQRLLFPVAIVTSGPLSLGTLGQTSLPSISPVLHYSSFHSGNILTKPKL